MRRSLTALLALAVTACGSRTGTLERLDAGGEGRPMDAAPRRDSGPRDEDAAIGIDGGARDGGRVRCVGADHFGSPIFAPGTADGLLGLACRFRRDRCRSVDALLVCVDERRDATGPDARCARCLTDAECSLEYRSYGPRGRDVRCRPDGQCELPPPPSGIGECDTTRECTLSRGVYACVDHRCVHCCSDAECSTDRIGLCEGAGTCVFPIPPG